MLKFYDYVKYRNLFTHFWWGDENERQILSFRPKFIHHIKSTNIALRKKYNLIRHYSIPLIIMRQYINFKQFLRFWLIIYFNFLSKNNYFVICTRVFSPQRYYFEWLSTREKLTAEMRNFSCNAMLPLFRRLCIGHWTQKWCKEKTSTDRI